MLFATHLHCCRTVLRVFKQVPKSWSHKFHTSTALSGETVTRLRRAFMYVPASDLKKVTKATTLGSDCVVIDCEDAVAFNKKEEARENVRKVLNDESSFEFGRSECSVRINDRTTGLAELDLEASLTASRLPQMINLPKVQEWTDLEWYFKTIRRYLLSRKVHQSLSVTIMIETALGFVNMKEILSRGLELSDDDVRLEAVVLGYDDFAASVGFARTAECTEMLAVRQMFVVLAKAFQLQVIDTVFTDFKDDEGLKKQSLEAYSYGYTGKQVIHPGQVAIVHQAFTPSQERLDWAQQLVSAFDEHQATGKGAFTFGGKMVDLPVYQQAKSIVDLMRNV